MISKDDRKLFCQKNIKIIHENEEGYFVKFVTEKSKTEWIVIQFDGDLDKPVSVWRDNLHRQDFISVGDAMSQIQKYEQLF